ncbi:hypothetical protein SAMN05444396_102408 [Flavobacterium segetis]|uniref:VanZ like family protein n=1 Tax=Flavobacterium segetis TaxID=271157 RepID=A0A1M5FJB9_9FLAO|nr:hypothetical protein [Flavobacterium segetis]SHF91261.1 hypothetical protein SAMN05444396_102408 [Flavobacterium segetis]
MFRKVLYFTLFILVLTIYVMQRLKIPLPALVNNYTNDLLYLPLVLGAIEFIIRRLKKDASFTLPLGFVIFLSCSYSFYFEYYLPKINLRYTGDWIDVILYFVGGIAFFFVGRTKRKIINEEDKIESL